MILGYTFTALNYLLYCVSRFCEKKYQMLTLDLLAKSLRLFPDPSDIHHDRKLCGAIVIFCTHTKLLL